MCARVDVRSVALSRSGPKIFGEGEKKKAPSVLTNVLPHTGKGRPADFPRPIPLDSAGHPFSPCLQAALSYVAGEGGGGGGRRELVHSVGGARGRAELRTPNCAHCACTERETAAWLCLSAGGREERGGEGGGEEEEAPAARARAHKPTIRSPAPRPLSLTSAPHLKAHWLSPLLPLSRAAFLMCSAVM